MVKENVSVDNVWLGRKKWGERFLKDDFAVAVYVESDAPNSQVKVHWSFVVLGAGRRCLPAPGWLCVWWINW
jgi:hypothetical protein